MEYLLDFLDGLDQRLLIFALTGIIAALLAGIIYQDRHMPKWMLATYIVSMGLMAAAGLSLFYPPLMRYTQYMRLTSFVLVALTVLIEVRQSVPAKDATPEQIEAARRQKRYGLLVIMGVFIVGMVAFPYIRLLDKQEQAQGAQVRADRTLNKNTGILYEIKDSFDAFRAYVMHRDSLIDAQMRDMRQDIEQMKQSEGKPRRNARRVSYSAETIPPRTPADTTQPVDLSTRIAVRRPY